MDSLRRLIGLVMSSPALEKIAWKSAYAAKFDRWVAANRFEEVLGRRQLHEHVMRTFHDVPILYLEFGVHKGHSLRWWLEGNMHQDSRFVGFDSFEGLPETWRKDYPKGYFSTGRMPPDIADPRCHFEVGWFQQTLPRFVREQSFAMPLVAHLDADLYSSTLYVLFTLAPFLKPGDILLFDDFPDTLHVFRALSDFLAAYPLPLQPVARNQEMRRIAVRVGTNGAGAEYLKA